MYLFHGCVAALGVWIMTLLIRIGRETDIKQEELLALIPLMMAALHFCIKFRYAKRYYQWHSGEDRSLR